MKFIDEAYKDANPINTVNHIKEILKSNGIETTERWMESSVPYCYAVRVDVVGTTFGTNGKGLSKELALASGYGELMERLQLGYITGGTTQKDGNFCVNDAMSQRVSAAKLLEENPKIYSQIAARLQEFTGEKCEPERMVMQFADGKGNVVAAPYYNLTRGQVEYFPSEIRKRVYNANGCAAGNTMEEALVQGLSETVERNHVMRLLSEEITPPDVPEEVLQQYKTSYEIITYIRSKGYKVTVKDCSLGTKFPMLCVCYVDQKTGKYHTHFGAYPVFEIALARTLTESFQGRTIENVARYDVFFNTRAEACSIRNIANELGKGDGQKQLKFFVGTPDYPYNYDVGFRGANNKELLQECVEYFQEMGYELLVRDGSGLGFPTYQILIPGYSEIFIYRLLEKQDELKYLPLAVKTLQAPGEAKLESIMGLLMHIARIDVFDRKVSGVYGFNACARVSTTMTAAQNDAYMALNLAYIYYKLGKLKEAYKALCGAMMEQEIGSIPYLACLKKYLMLQQAGETRENIFRILPVFHGQQEVERLKAAIDRGENPLETFVLNCKMDCTEKCPLYKVCCQKRVQELAGLINDKNNQIDFAQFTRKLQSLFT